MDITNTGAYFFKKRRLKMLIEIEEMLNKKEQSYFDDESEALTFLVSEMRANGYYINPNDYYLCCVRGGLNITKLDRIQNYGKRFKAHQIKEELKSVYEHIKEKCKEY